MASTSDVRLSQRARTILAGAAVAALGSALAFDHAPDRAGLAAQEITPQAVAEAADALAAEDASQWLTGRLVLDFVDPQDGEDGSEAEIEDFVADLDARADVEVDKAGFYSEGEHLFTVTASPQTLAMLGDALDSPLLEGVEPEIMYALPQGAIAASLPEGPEDEPADAQRGPRLSVDDPMFRLQWHMEQIHAPEAWMTTRGEGTVVAVIDTGVAYANADGVRALPDLNRTEFVAGESFIEGLPRGLDDHAHGSHVAGTIAQSTNNGVGVTGVAYGAKIMPLKVLSKDGRGAVPGIANAIRYAADHGAHVINMSLGGPLPSRVLAKAIEYAHGKGVVTVCAAGNERRSKVGYPAANKFSIAVSATDYGRELTHYSNWGADIDVAAPGGDTRADRNGDGQPDGVLQNTIRIGRPLENDYLWFQGTSMASPHAAGVAALIVASGVTNPDEVERVMKATAVHPKGVKWDERFGAGIVDAQAAVATQSNYAPERAGFTGLLLLGAFGALGLAGLRGRARWFGAAGFFGAAALTSGALGTTPLSYQAAAWAGGADAWLGFGSPLWFSAALPLLASVTLLRVRGLRPALVGLGLGTAAMLLHGAFVLPTLVTALPGGPWVDRAWLLGNGLLAWALARRVGRLDTTA
ncbi:MAG: S8 family peptidase [Nannocystaceae bacterium]